MRRVYYKILLTRKNIVFQLYIFLTLFHFTDKIFFFIDQRICMMVLEENPVSYIPQYVRDENNVVETIRVHNTFHYSSIYTQSTVICSIYKCRLLCAFAWTRFLHKYCSRVLEDSSTDSFIDSMFSSDFRMMKRPFLE